MIQPKYKIGDTVYAASVSYDTQSVQCPDCLGTREWDVSLPSGEKFKHDCQTCREGFSSTGKVDVWGDHARVRKLTIGSIRVDTADKDRPVAYMCTETGVGSGYVYDERVIFLTKEEANEWCAQELVRVAGFRQKEEDAKRTLKRKDPLIHGKRNKK